VAYSHYVRCPNCSRIGVSENRTPLELLAMGRANVTIDCVHCGFFKDFQSISAAEFEALSVSEKSPRKRWAVSAHSRSEGLLGLKTQSCHPGVLSSFVGDPARGISVP
jgi:uncharacterized Zn finger protein